MLIQSSESAAADITLNNRLSILVEKFSINASLAWILDHKLHFVNTKYNFLFLSLFFVTKYNLALHALDKVILYYITL